MWTFWLCGIQIFVHYSFLLLHSNEELFTAELQCSGVTGVSVRFRFRFTQADKKKRPLALTSSLILSTPQCAHRRTLPSDLSAFHQTSQEWDPFLDSLPLSDNQWNIFTHFFLTNSLTYFLNLKLENKNYTKKVQLRGQQPQIASHFCWHVNGRSLFHIHYSRGCLGQLKTDHPEKQHPYGL